MKKLAYYIGILVCTSIFASSCIKEDLSDCPAVYVSPTGAIPRIVLVPIAGSKPAIVNDSLYSGQVYVFDEQGTFVSTYTIPDRPQLNKPYTFDKELPFGKYTYVAWLNDNQSFQVDPCVAGKSIQSQTLLQLKIPQTKIVDNTGSIPFLCYGHLDNEVLDSTKDNIITIPVMQFPNKINVRMTNMKNAPSPTDTYTISIKDNNGVYGFDGNFASNDWLTYSTTAQAQANSDIMDASLTVLKLSKDRPNPTLILKSNATGEEYSIPLIQQILSAYPNNDFDKIHEYYIEIPYPFGNDKEVPVTITIDGWVDDPSNNDLTID